MPADENLTNKIREALFNKGVTAVEEKKCLTAFAL